MLLVLGLCEVLSAQTAATKLPEELQPELPLVPGQQPRSGEKIASFVDSLSRNDAAFEVIKGQGRVLTLKEDLAEANQPVPVIAAGDPEVIDYEVIGPRQIRILGKQFGTTDLSIITTSEETYSFEVRVVVDLDMLRARLKSMFPATEIQLAQLNGHLVVEGQVRSTEQVARVLETLEGYIQSKAGEEDSPGIINLLHVPGPQQIMLKVQIAELNRTAMRQFGFSFGVDDGDTAVGSNISGAFADIMQDGTGQVLLQFVNPSTTFSGVRFISETSLKYFVDALRENGVMKILAEPNLVTMNGHEASFLAGGEVPIPVPQTGTAGQPTFTIEFKEFGVRLGFLPFITDDESIRLSVDPEVSNIDESIGVSLIGGDVPGFTTRRAHTVVELDQGQTLAIAGLLQLQLSGNTRRLPLVGDLPVLGPFFSNNTGERLEKELVVLVTPYFVEPMYGDQIPPLPGAEVNEPNDLEFYLLGRIESRIGKDFRSTTKWDDPLHLVKRLKLESRYCRGPHGYTD